MPVRAPRSLALRTLRWLPLFLAGALVGAPGVGGAQPSDDAAAAAQDEPAPRAPGGPVEVPAPPASPGQPAAAPPEAVPPAPPSRPTEAAASLGRLRLDPRRLLPHYEYLEDSSLDYFFPNVGPARDLPLFFEAQAAVHLFVWNQWPKAQVPRGDRGWLWVNSLGVTFLLHLRMLQEPSAPVRPPSYIPRIDYQLFALRRSGADLVDQVELRITPWGHHSNGQQYCTFATGVTDRNPAPEDCVTPDRRTRNYLDTVNFRTGDFSTSYFIVGGHYARIGLDPERWTRWRWGFGGLFEGNPRPWGPGTIPRQLAELYGQWRAKLEVELRYHLARPRWPGLLAGMASLTASGEHMWPTAPGIPRDRAIVQLAFQPDDLGGMGAFVRYFDGQDDLNVLFAAGRTRMVALGILWSGSPQVQYTFGDGR